jgi:hypothetical protein
MSLREWQKIQEMPRRRSGLTFGPAAAAVGAAVVVVAGCQVASMDNGCQVARQLVLPDTTPLALISDVQIERAGSGFVLLGADAASVRWTALDANGTFGTEQAFALPAGTLRAYYALAGVDSPGDRVIIGLLTPATNGRDAELHFVAAPTDGSTPPAPGIAIATFGGGANPQSPPSIAMGTSASAMYAGVAWIDTGPLLPMYALLDGQGEIAGQPAVIDSEPAAAFGCLGFGPGKEELTISYQRTSQDAAVVRTWLIADVVVGGGGGVATLKLNVTLPGGGMSCARSVLYTPPGGGAPEYAMVWQDGSGSWLSVYYGPQTNMVKSFPFSSATDFGGAGLQPRLVGLATFGNDFGVLFERTHSVELWRIDEVGNRHSGTLVLPSRQGDIGAVSSVSSTGLLTSTYADLTGPGSGRRLVIDAACY